VQIKTGISVARILTESLTDASIFSLGLKSVPSRSSATASIAKGEGEIWKSPLESTSKLLSQVYDFLGVNIDPFLKTAGCLFEAEARTLPPMAPKETKPTAAKGRPFRNVLLLNVFFINLLFI